MVPDRLRAIPMGTSWNTSRYPGRVSPRRSSKAPWDGVFDGFPLSGLARWKSS